MIMLNVLFIISRSISPRGDMLLLLVTVIHQREITLLCKLATFLIAPQGKLAGIQCKDYSAPVISLGNQGY